MLLIAARQAQACSCVQVEILPCEEFWDAVAVFTGVVKSIERLPATIVEDGKAHSFRATRVRLAVENAYRGLLPGQSEVIVDTGYSNCTYSFKTGRRYLVYAEKGRHSRHYDVSKCSRTRLLSEARVDLAYIGQLPESDPSTRIFGSVGLGRNPWNPLGGVTIQVDGQGQQFETTTDKGGKFEFVKLPPGEYRVGARLGGFMDASDSDQKVQARAHGCAGWYFFLVPDTRIRGRVTDASGGPVGNAEVAVLPLELGGWAARMRIDSERTNENGQYEIKRVPPGRFLLGINVDRDPRPEAPYSATYYPGVAVLEQAAIIDISDGQTIEAQDFRLPAPFPKRQIEGMVAWRSGRPAALASVIPEAADDPVERPIATLEADSNGRFSYEALDGIRYHVQASAVDEKGRKWCTPAATVAKEGQAIPLKLTLSERSDRCQHRHFDWR